MADEQDTRNVTVTVTAEDISSISEFANGEAIALKKATELSKILSPMSNELARSIAAVTDSIALDAARAVQGLNDAHTRVVGQLAQSMILFNSTSIQKVTVSAMHGLAQSIQRISPSIDALTLAPLVDVSAMQGLAQSIQTAASSINALTLIPRFPEIKFRPILQDIFDVKKYHDRDAAQRLAERIQWSPGGWKDQAISLRARDENKSFDSLLSEALTGGVMRVVACIDDRIPLALPNDSRFLSTPDGEPMTTSPLEWDVWMVWEWLSQESIRAAEMWLFGIPYTPVVMLNAPPDEHGNLEFAAFAVIDQLVVPAGPLSGRPIGTGTFSNRDEFLVATRVAAVEARKRHNKVNQERVAEAMARKALLGRGAPIRQLRRYTSQFGFVDWADLLNHLE